MPDEPRSALETFRTPGEPTAEYRALVVGRLHAQMAAISASVRAVYAARIARLVVGTIAIGVAITRRLLPPPCWDDSLFPLFGIQQGAALGFIGLGIVFVALHAGLKRRLSARDWSLLRRRDRRLSLAALSTLELPQRLARRLAGLRGLSIWLPLVGAAALLSNPGLYSNRWEEPICLLLSSPPLVLLFRRSRVPRRWDAPLVLGWFAAIALARHLLLHYAPSSSCNFEIWLFDLFIVMLPLGALALRRGLATEDAMLRGEGELLRPWEVTELLKLVGKWTLVVIVVVPIAMMQCC